MFINRYFVVILLAANYLFASEGLNVYLGGQDGESNYYVNNASSNFLESKLIFPIESHIMGLEFQKNVNKYRFNIGFEDQIKDTQETKHGEDFDWKNHIPTVYSFSNNFITKNQTFFLESSTDIDLDVINNITLRISQKKLNFKWTDTEQYNYTTDTSTLLQGDTLRYSQKIQKIGLSLLSNKESSNLLYKGWINYYDIVSRDEHIVRNLETTTHNHGFGYEVELGYKYLISENASLKALLKYERFKDADTMSYHLNSTTITSYPSTMEYKIFSSLLGFEYSFK